MAAKNGYTPMQSSGLYITDGDEIDWAYGRHRIFMYTFELYPSHATSARPRFYPPTRSSGRETERNKSAILYLIDVAGCLYAPIGKTQTHCGPFNDDFEICRGWQINPLGTDTATGGALAARQPGRTNYQAGTATSGSNALVTGARAGSTSSSNDVDGGRRPSARRRSPCRATVGRLTFRYYLAHASNATRRTRSRPSSRRPDGDADAGPRRARGGEHGPSGVGLGLDLDDAVGRSDGPDRVRGDRRWPRVAGRGRRRRRAGHATRRRGAGTAYCIRSVCRRPSG